MSDHDGPLLSVVMPAFNEAAGIQTAIQTVGGVLGELRYSYEIVVVDDGSHDDTFALAVAMCDAGLRVRAIKLSRHFGKEAALLAGLQHAQGDAVITIDADLQHPPSLIPSMIDAWERGTKVVHGVKRSRGDESWWSAVRAKMVNALITRLGGVDVRDSSDFKLLDRAAVDLLTNYMPERKRFYRGLAGWIGLSQAFIDFDVAPRRRGKSGWSVRSLLALSLTALISFTSAPLRIVSILGLATLLLGVALAADALWSWFRGVAVSGFATIIMTILIIGSFTMISLGVIGEYIAKIYDEIKQRPVFVIDRVHNGQQTRPGRDQDQSEQNRVSALTPSSPRQ